MRGMSWGSHLKPIHHRGYFQVHSAVFEEKWIACSHSIPCKKKQLRGTFFSSDKGAFLSPPSPIQMSAGCSKPAVQTETHGWHEWDEWHSRGVCFSLIKTEVDEMSNSEQPANFSKSTWITVWLRDLNFPNFQWEGVIKMCSSFITSLEDPWHHV